MLKRDDEREVWSMSVVVFHGPAFGHRMELWTQERGRDPLVQSLGSWKGLGVPAQVLESAVARADAVMSEYLTHRYGVQGTLWAGEPVERAPF